MQAWPAPQHVPLHAIDDVLGQQIPLVTVGPVGPRHCSVELQHCAPLAQSCANGQHMLASADVHCSEPSSQHDAPHCVKPELGSGQ